jgi:hypothetical protein
VRRVGGAEGVDVVQHVAPGGGASLDDEVGLGTVETGGHADTQSKTSKASRKSADVASARTRMPNVVSKKPRRENRSLSLRIACCRAWKNSRDGKVMAIGVLGGR